MSGHMNLLPPTTGSSSESKLSPTSRPDLYAPRIKRLANDGGQSQEEKRKISVVKPPVHTAFPLLPGRKRYAAVNISGHLRMTGTRIYFMCPDLDEPRGGVRVIYRHVDVLNAAGFDAAVVHYQPGFQIRWFSHRTCVLHLPVDLRPRDILVFPEIDGPAIADAGGTIRKVIFNQNAYYTFQHYPVDQSIGIPPYMRPEVVATIVVSEDSLGYLRHTFPEAVVHRVHWSIDPQFHHPGRPKARQVCYMPRKHPEDSQQVINILRYRRALEGFRIVPIHNMPEMEAARIMGESMVFLSFGYPEGCPLPPAEAMASGCVTIGYHGNGGREYMRPDLAFPIEAGDIIGFAKAAEHVLVGLRRDPNTYADMTARASRFIHTTYSAENERNDIVSAWRQILDLS